MRQSVLYLSVVASVGFCLISMPAIILSSSAEGANRPEVFGLPLPERAKLQIGTTYVTPLPFRSTVSFYKSRLKKKGIRFREVPVYQYRGTTVSRILAQDPSSAWSAIHVFRNKGRTYLTFVPRASDLPVESIEADESSGNS